MEESDGQHLRRPNDNARPQDRRVSRLAGVEEGRLEVKVKKEDWLILYDPETGLVKWILLRELKPSKGGQRG